MSDKIVVLSDKDQARKRINVFHGSASNWINMIKELIGNSLDVFDKDTLNKISINIIDNRTIEYIDSGKGIPLEGVASDGRKNYEAIFEKAFAGSKYNNTGKTVGQNGLFLYTLAMTCEDIKFEVARPCGSVYQISYHKGDRCSELIHLGTSDKTYTKILFTLDNEVWKDINFTYEEICAIAQGQAALGNVSIDIVDNQTGKSNTFYYEGGIEEYFNELTDKKDLVTDYIRISKTINQQVEEDVVDELDIRFIMRYSNDSNKDIQKDFLNTADLIQYGTIQEGIVNGLRRIIDKWLKSNGKYNKSEKSISKDDVIVGLNYICTIDSLYVEYDNQVKQKTSAVHYRQAIQTLLDDFFDIFQIENKFEFERICNQVLINKRANEKAASIRKDVKKKLSEKISITSKVEGLIECKSKDITKRRILICEGKSALSGLIDGRTEYQALFPLRGKVLNCFKASDEQIFKNDVIINLFRALNCGIEYGKKSAKKDVGGDFNLDNLRYQGVDIVVDSDVDGVGSICPLILAMFYKLAPTLIQEGRIRLILTPLYEIVCGSDDYYYAVDDEELKEIENKLKGKKYSVHYVKGIGELSKHTMKYCLQEDYKRVYTFTMDNYEESFEKLEIFMGKDIEKRKEYILKEY